MAVPQKHGSLNLAHEGAEREWLAQPRTEDAKAVEAMFLAYAAPLCDCAFSYVHAREIAEEIVQDLFCWIWEQRFTIEMPHGMRPWLFTAVRNHSLNVLRNRQGEIPIREPVS